MHRGESAPQAAFALHDHAKQEKPAHAQSAREKEIQSITEAAYSPSGNKVNYRRATENSKASFRISTGESHHAASANRHRDRSDRLQKSGCVEKICHRKRQDSPAPCHWHACAFASQDHSRDQAQPLSLVDEIIVGRLYQALILWLGVSQKRPTENRRALGLSCPFALLDQLPKLACFAQLRILRDR